MTNHMGFFGLNKSQAGFPDDAQGLDLFTDRDQALKIFAKYREISNSEVTFDKFRTTFDPTKPGALAQFEVYIL